MATAFLTWQVVYSRQSEPVVPVKDVTSDMAVISKKVRARLLLLLWPVVVDMAVISKKVTPSSPPCDLTRALS